MGCLMISNHIEIRILGLSFAFQLWYDENYIIVPRIYKLSLTIYDFK